VQQTADGFQLVIDALKLNGIDTIYGCRAFPITDLTRRRQAAGPARAVVPPRAERGLRRVDRRLPHAEARHLPHGVAPGFLNGLNALAHATVNCFPMILISGSSEREIVDLQQGDYEEMDQLAIAKPVAKAAFRVLHAEDIGVGIARAIRAAVSGPAGRRVSRLARQAVRAGHRRRGGQEHAHQGGRSRAEADSAPEAVKRALDLLRSAKKPLIILGKGAAYAQVDADIKALIEKTGIPYLPMSMAKGLLPTRTSYARPAARSFVLPGADVVMLIGARLNWLLSHGKGKTWGGKGHKDWGGQKFIQIDISPQEADSNVRIDAPVVGDIGSCVSALLKESVLVAETPGGMAERRRREEERQRRQDGRDAGEESLADELPQRAQRGARHREGQPGRDAGERGRQRARLHALDRRHVQAAQAHRRRHLGHHGRRHGLLRRRRGGDQAAGDRDRGRQRVRLLGMEVETICRYNLPVCIVIMNNNGVYKGTDVDPNGRDPAPTVFVKGARYDKLIEAFGGVGVNATTPAELRKAMEERCARRSRR
jgi:oxalyl-CoA decarboxylase